MSRCYVCGSEEESDEHLASETMGTVWTLCRKCMAATVVKVEGMRRNARVKGTKCSRSEVLAVMADGRARSAAEIADALNRGRAQEDRICASFAYWRCSRMVETGFLVHEKHGKRVTFRRAAE